MFLGPTKVSCPCSRQLSPQLQNKVTEIHYRTVNHLYVLLMNNAGFPIQWEKIKDKGAETTQLQEVHKKVFKPSWPVSFQTPVPNPAI